MEQISTKLPGLLSLTGKVEHLLLFYLGASEGGGVQGLLNLRLVCQTTRDWIDDLSPRLGQRVFSRVVVRVDLVKMAQGELWQSFLDAPPPSPVTSLSLNGVEELPMLLNSSSISLEMWSRFTDYWSSKLKSLEVDRFPVDRNRLIRKLLDSNELEHFRCEDLFSDDSKHLRVYANFMLNLKTLRIDRFEIYGRKREWFLNKLLDSKSLRVIDLLVHTLDDFDTINSILKTRKDESNLKMIFRIFPYYIESYRNSPPVSISDWSFGEIGGSTLFTLRPLPLLNYIRFQTFLESVAQCKCPVDIVGLNEPNVSKTITMIRSRIEDEDNAPSHRQCKVAKLGRAETPIIKLFQTMNTNKQIDSFESLDVSSHFDKYRRGFLLRVVSLGDLTSLRIWLEAYKADFNRELAQLASDSVTNLSIKLIKPHGGYLMVKVLDGVALNFPCVEKLELFWDNSSANKPNNTREHLLHENRITHQTTNLKTLTLNIRCNVTDEKEVVNDVRDVLLHIISQLPLQSLTVQVYRQQYINLDLLNLPVVDEFFLSSFLERRIGTTLTYFRVSDNLSVPGVRKQIKSVISVTRGNKKKLKKPRSTCNVI